MSEFFHGWRRKAGVVALLMACLFTAGWVRSRLIYDLIGFKIGERQQMIHVTSGRIYWWGVSASTNTWIWQAKKTRPPIEEERGGWSDDEGWKWKFREWIVLHSAVAISMTVLSAYLILIPSRKQPPTTSQPHA